MNTNNSNINERIMSALQRGGVKLSDTNSTNIELVEELNVYYRELQYQNDELRETQEKLLVAKNEMADLLEFSPVGYAIYNDDFNISYANREFAKIANIEEWPIKNHNLLNYIAPESQDDFYFYNRNFKSERKKNDSIVLEIKCAHNQRKVRIDTTVLSNSNERKYISTFIDLTNEFEKQKVLDEKQNELNISNIKLRESEEMFRLIAENISDGILFLDKTNTITYASPSYKKMNNLLNDIDVYLNKDEIYNRIHPDDRDIVFEKIFLAINNKAENLVYSYRIQNSQGGYGWREDHSRFVYDEHLNYEGVYVITRDITERVEAFKKLETYQEEIMKYSLHIQTVREEERNMLAREIHDDLGQILVALKIDIGLLSKNFCNDIDKNFSTKFDEIIKLVDRTIKTTRRIIAELRSDELEVMSLTDAIANYAQAFEKRYNTKCEYYNSINDIHLNDQQKIAVYRIVQEALNNIAKHAHAKKVSIVSRFEDDKVVLKIKDDGIGFDVHAKQNSNSYGLIGIKERARMLNAEVVIKSEHGIGTEITVATRIQDL